MTLRRVAFIRASQRVGIPLAQIKAAAAAGEGIAISLNALFKGYYSPDFCREATLWNVKFCFGFVTDADRIIKGLPA